MVVAMRAFQPAHIFDDPDDRHFAVFAKCDRLAGIQQGHFLGVVMITAPLTLPSRSMVVTDSLPVPGGRSIKKKFKSCHSTPPKS